MRTARTVRRLLRSTCQSGPFIPVAEYARIHTKQGDHHEKAVRTIRPGGHAGGYRLQYRARARTSSVAARRYREPRRTPSRRCSRNSLHSRAGHPVGNTASPGALCGAPGSFVTSEFQCPAVPYGPWRAAGLPCRGLCGDQRCLPAMTSAMPPSTAAALTASRWDMVSPSSARPPAAAITGTLSWTVAAVAARSCGTTAYQTT